SSRSHSGIGSTAETFFSPDVSSEERRAMRPSATASAATRGSSESERRASSLPGGGEGTAPGAQVVEGVAVHGGTGGLGAYGARGAGGVGCAAGVDDADDLDAELLGLTDGEVLLLRVDDPDGRRGALHIADAAEGLLQLVLLAAKDEQLLLRVRGACHVVEVDLFEFLQAAQTPGDGLEVREHTAEPTLVDVGLAHALGLFGDGFLSLLLGS